MSTAVEMESVHAITERVLNDLAMVVASHPSDEALGALVAEAARAVEAVQNHRSSKRTRVEDQVAAPVAPRVYNHPAIRVLGDRSLFAEISAAQDTRRAERARNVIERLRERGRERAEEKIESALGWSEDANVDDFPDDLTKLAEAARLVKVDPSDPAWYTALNVQGTGNVFTNPSTNGNTRDLWKALVGVVAKRHLDPTGREATIDDLFAYMRVLELLEDFRSHVYPHVYPQGDLLVDLLVPLEFEGDDEDDE